MNLCDWCEQPAGEGKELCGKCEDAQAKVAAGKLIPPPRQKERTVLQQVMSGLVFSLKLIAACVLSIVMVVAGLLGACAAFLAYISHPNPLIPVLVIVAGVVVTVLMIKLMNYMFQTPPKRLRQAQPLPPPLMAEPPDQAPPGEP